LIGVSIVGLAATVLMVVLSFAERPENPSEDDQTSFVAFLLFMGVLVLLETVLFLSGRYLRRSSPDQDVTEATVKCSRVRPLPLAVYLAGGIGIGLFASFGGKILPSSKALAFLIGQPQVLTQLFGGILGLKVVEGAARQVITITANLLYFLALFYPVYGMVTTDRAVEVARFKWMKILLILFGGVHVLTAMVLAMLLRA
jgi:hypothetical protein